MPTPPWVRQRNRRRIITAFTIASGIIIVIGLLLAARYRTVVQTTTANIRIESATRQQTATPVEKVNAEDNDAVQYGSSCGLENWAKKTLMLPGDRVLPTTPVQTSIEHLMSLTPPTNSYSPERVNGVEDREWSIRAILLGVKLEPDSDYHLVLADPTNPLLMMIGEIPASYCTQSNKASEFAAARRSVDLITHYRVSNRFRWLDRNGVQSAPLVIADGYGFFDRVGSGHREVGGAPSGVELHPVLSVHLARP